ncbi:glycosyltransferase family 4 protein [Candidatus Electrothrix sp.]|uniref:glycosyltransferase family 4 protein n=1 Tax=Candidatus Electrothrix sp. TaxID=2170559 RepID=UPI0040576863
MSLNKSDYICMLIYHYWPDKVGGAEQSCRRLAAGLAEHGYKCIVLTARTNLLYSRIEKDGNVTIRRFFVPEAWVAVLRSIVGFFQSSKTQSNDHSNSPSRPKEPLRKTIGLDVILSRLLKYWNSLFFMSGVSMWCFWHRKRISILHVHTSDWIAGVAGWLCHWHGIHALCKESTFPALPEYTQGIPFRSALNMWRKRLPFIAQNPNVKEDLVAKGIRQDCVFVIPNPIPICGIERHEHQSPFVLWIGNASQGIDTKGLDVLASSWERIKHECPSATLALLGAGVDDKVHSLFDSQNSNGVEFFGYVDDVNIWIKRAWVVVLPSRREGMSNALLESMALGVPVVASNIPGNKYIVKHDITGRLFSSEDSSSLTQEVLKLIDSPDERKRLGDSAQQYVVDHYDKSSVVLKTIACYESLHKGSIPGC